MAVQQWTTTGFELSPAGVDSPAGGDDKIRELKETAGSLLDKEHLARDAGSTALQGWHREGSAIAYYEAAAPTNRPDAATALGATDAGRLWIDSDDGTMDYWDGSAWQDLVTFDQDLNTTDDVQFNSVTGDLTGTADDADGINEDNGEVVKMKIIDIGAWDMDATGIKDVTHGIADYTKIRAVSAWIFDDDGLGYYNLNASTTTVNVDGYVYTVTTTFIRLIREESGKFDSASFNDTGVNRGHVTIWYVGT